VNEVLGARRTCNHLMNDAIQRHCATEGPRPTALSLFLWPPVLAIIPGIAAVSCLGDEAKGRVVDGLTTSIL
jgi:hypothetical protein